jgi:hypothetical protein
MLHDFMVSADFIQTPADHCLFVKRGTDHLCIVVVYVDDLIILSSSPQSSADFKARLATAFDIKDLGDLRYVLVLKFERTLNPPCIRLHQDTYIRKVVGQLGLTDANPSKTPLEPKLTLPKLEGASDTEYRSVVGALMYAMVGTRPDIAVAVGAVSRHLECPGAEHWTALKRIGRYLAGSTGLSLQYKASGKRKPVLTCYVDSDWASDDSDRRSTTGYLLCLASAPVSWASRKQPTVALSSTEAEYMAASAAIQEVVWARALLHQLGFPQDGPTTVFEDNQGCIALSRNPVNHTRTKHIDVRHHFVREKVQDGQVSLVYLPTADMTADLLTKGLHPPQFHRLVKLMGMC